MRWETEKNIFLLELKLKSTTWGWMCGNAIIIISQFVRLACQINFDNIFCFWITWMSKFIEGKLKHNKVKKKMFFGNQKLSDNLFVIVCLWWLWNVKINWPVNAKWNYKYFSFSTFKNHFHVFFFYFHIHFVDKMKCKEFFFIVSWDWNLMNFLQIRKFTSHTELQYFFFVDKSTNLFQKLFLFSLTKK